MYVFSPSDRIKIMLWPVRLLKQVKTPLINHLEKNKPVYLFLANECDAKLSRQKKSDVLI